MDSLRWLQSQWSLVCFYNLAYTCTSLKRTSACLIADGCVGCVGSSPGCDTDCVVHTTRHCGTVQRPWGQVHHPRSGSFLLWIPKIYWCHYQKPATASLHSDQFVEYFFISWTIHALYSEHTFVKGISPIALLPTTTAFLAHLSCKLKWAFLITLYLLSICPSLCT